MLAGCVDLHLRAFELIQLLADCSLCNREEELFREFLNSEFLKTEQRVQQGLAIKI